MSAKLTSHAAGFVLLCLPTMVALGCASCSKHATEHHVDELGGDTGHSSSGHEEHDGDVEGSGGSPGGAVADDAGASGDGVSDASGTSRPPTRDGGAGNDAGGSASSDAGGNASNDAGSKDSGPPPNTSAGPVTFPLKIGASGRYLVDQNNRPFLINQASSWGLIQSLSTADAKDYLDALAQRGFNTVMVSIISYDVRFAGNPPKWQGISPFTVEWDFSTYNEAYFAHADEIIRLAEQRGMLVTLVPAYLGYSTEPTQGWADELLSGNNSVAKSQAYGQFLGKRYKGFSNVIWLAGGDNTPGAGSELEKRHKAIIDGIRQSDTVHLWTGHWDSVSRPNGVLSTDYATLAGYMNINGYYAFNYDFTQQRDQEAYMRSPTMMYFHLDQSYETEPGGSTDNIRRKAYSAMLLGAAGSSFCAGPVWYLFAAWRANMDTTGSRENQYWFRLFASRRWYDLVPDLDHSVVTAGVGRIDTLDYVAAARASNGNSVIAYLPAGRSVTLDMSKISGSQAHAWWYDPTKGTATSIGTFATSGSKAFSSPTSGSWALVVDDDSLHLASPGTL